MQPENDPLEDQPQDSSLNKSERILLALLESASQAIVGVDQQGRIVLTNARTEEMFGYAREELLGNALETLLPEDRRAVHAHHRADYFTRPRVRPMGIGMDLAGRHKDGRRFPVEISLSYVETEEGIFAFAFITDITERKRLEEQLVHSQKMEAVGRLAGGIAHDFNNMLTVISGYGRMTLNKLSPRDPLRAYSEEVVKAADRAADLTNQLLAFSRRQVIQPRILNVNGLIANTKRMLERLIGEDVESIFSLAPDIRNIKADPSQIEQAIFNLVVNARDAMPGGGRLYIETANVRLDEAYARMHAGVQPGEYVLIAVTDTGVGMDAEIQRHIFEPFFTTKEKGKGTGLGLATVFGMVKQSGGDIWVYSEPGKGSTFKLYFPAVVDAADPAVAGPDVVRRRGAETVLIVEDEVAVRDLLGIMLRELGYTVLAATDPRDALRIAETDSTIDVLVTDLIMPQMSGKHLAAEMRRLRPEVKVLFLSGYNEEAVVHHGLLDPEVNFLPKPFSQQSLAKKMAEMLQHDDR